MKVFSPCVFLLICVRVQAEGYLLMCILCEFAHGLRCSYMCLFLAFVHMYLSLCLAWSKMKGVCQWGKKKEQGVGGRKKSEVDKHEDIDQDKERGKG